MHRSVRFVLQPYKSRNPPLAAVTQARRDANSGSYGYKAVVTKQPLNRGCPMPDIAHAPDQIRTSPRKLPACSCGNLSLQRILRTSSSNIILHFPHNFNSTNSKIFIYFRGGFYAYYTICVQYQPKIRLRTGRGGLFFHHFCQKCISSAFLQLQTMYQSISIAIFDSSSASSAFAARSLSRESQKSLRSHSGSIILISASAAISAPKNTLMF